MKRYLLALVLAAAFGCRQDRPAGSAAGSAGSAGSAAIAPANIDAAVIDAKPACDLTGAYRLRIQWTATKQHWFRFRVDGTPPVATLTEEPWLGPFAGGFDTVTDTTACTLTLGHDKGKRSETRITLAIDPMTNVVTGRLFRQSAKHADTPMKGMRDAVPQTIAPADACFEPGVYVVSVDPKHAWIPDEPHTCEDSAKRLEDVVLRLEWLGSNLVLETVKPSAPWRENGLAEETFERKGPCEGELEVNLGRFELDATLTFGAGGRVTGVAKEARYVVFQDFDVDKNMPTEDIWYCRAKHISLAIKRISKQ